MARLVKVSVLFFASLKEDIGQSELMLEVTETAGRDELATALAEALGGEQVAPLFAENVAIAINQNIAKGDFELHAGDEVAFLPPITGG